MTGMGRKGTDALEIERIYRERFRAFLFTVTALLADGDAALDVVQDGFAHALRRRGDYRGEGTLEAWLWRIVLNVARDRRRTRSREQRLTATERSPGAAQPDEDLRALISALPERQRLAVFLRYYADLSYDEIAEALGVKAGTVAASLNAAHKTLRRNLEEVTR
jgi:RNA polymerase sigma-70 factor (ECF subfamily)